ncbi:MAG: magnesium transporter CorA family protein [Elusimicrobia bacterium]|nr:magnesium transporter CorA family protein [Elusimicrobiota bacterium]
MSDNTFMQVTPEGALRRCSGAAEALAAPGGGYVWLDYIDPSRADLEALVSPLGIHPLSVEDCLDEQQIPKIEDFPGSSFLLLNTFTLEERQARIDEVDFIIGPRFLVSVSGHTGHSPRFTEALERSLRLDSGSIRQGPDFLLHVLLDFVVDGKAKAIDAVQSEIESAEETILKNLSGFSLAGLARQRRQLLALRKSLFHEREVLVKICRRDSPFISEKSIYHFRDVYDHLTKFYEEVEVGREMIMSLMETYLSMVNNRMSAVANRTNATVRRLTLITTIFMPLSLLAGIGGMSEWSMMTGPENWRRSYPLLLAFMAAAGVATYFVLLWMEAKNRRSDKP